MRTHSPSTARHSASEPKIHGTMHKLKNGGAAPLLVPTSVMLARVGLVGGGGVLLEPCHPSRDGLSILWFSGSRVFLAFLVFFLKGFFEVFEGF